MEINRKESLENVALKMPRRGGFQERMAALERFIVPSEVTISKCSILRAQRGQAAVELSHAVFSSYILSLSHVVADNHLLVQFASFPCGVLQNSGSASSGTIATTVKHEFSSFKQFQGVIILLENFSVRKYLVVISAAGTGKFERPDRD